ncbi:MAG: hypothetical protein AB7Q27_00305, partial [Acidimicrobiia bacterium]
VPLDAVMRTRVCRDRVANRSDFRRSIVQFDCAARRARTYTQPAAELVGVVPGWYSVPVPISDDPAAKELTLTEAGLYPVEISITDAKGTALATILTTLIRLPTASSEPLRLALVMPLAAPATLDENGQAAVDAEALAAVAAKVDVLSSHPTVPLTIVPRPLTIEQLASSNPSSVASLRTALRGRQLITPPYVGIDARSLGPIEIGEQLKAGESVLSRVLGASGASQTWVVGAQGETSISGIPEIDDALVSSLSSLRVTRAIVPSGALQPFLAGEIEPARPFELATDSGAIMQAVAADDWLTRRLEANGASTDRLASLFGELMQIWMEDPESMFEPAGARGVVLLPSDRWNPTESELSALLDFVGSNSWLQPVTIDDYFTQVSSMRLAAEGTSAEPVVRSLNPLDPASDGASYVNELVLKRLVTASVGEMIPGDTSVAAVRTTLLLTSSSNVDATTRQSTLDRIGAELDSLRNVVSGLETTGASLLSRNQVIRLRIRRSTDTIVQVQLKLSGDKLEFPEGTTRTITLTDPVTEIDVKVKARASGSLILRAEFNTPDGRFQVGPPGRVRLRSFAVSGLGLILSIGALVFLGFWWIRDFRRRRRHEANASASRHPSAHLRS